MIQPATKVGMIIEVHLKTQSEPVRYEAVRNAYQKGTLYCIMLLSGEVWKYPIRDVFRIREIP